MAVESPVKVVKSKAKSLPADYIYRRGAEHTALDFAKEVISPPPGYFNLNLADGSTRLDHFINMNPVSGPNTDIPHPVEKYPWPFEDGACLIVTIGATLAQLANLDAFMNECWRVLVNTGKLHIMAPYYSSQTYWRNWRNIMPVADETFHYYSAEWLAAQGIEKELSCDFDLKRRTFYYHDYWELRGDVAKEFARQHYFNVVSAMEIDLVAVKPIRRF